MVLQPLSPLIGALNSSPICGIVCVINLGLFGIVPRVIIPSRMAWSNVSTVNWKSPNPWTITLPVLLGVRSAVKERLGRSAAEMIYGTTLRLPGEFTKQYTVDANTDLENYLDKLRVAMSRLRLCPPRDTQQHNIFQFKEIATCLCPPRDTQQHNIFQFKEIATCILAPNRNCAASDRPLRRTI